MLISFLFYLCNRNNNITALVIAVILLSAAEVLVTKNGISANLLIFVSTQKTKAGFLYFNAPHLRLILNNYNFHFISAYSNKIVGKY